MSRLVLLIGLLVTATSIASASDVLFEKDIRPILKAHCFQCHGEEEVRESSLDLRLRHWIAKGGDGGPAIEPGDPENSVLLQRIVDEEMPPGDKPLSATDVDLIRRWIAQGAQTAGLNLNRSTTI